MRSLAIILCLAFLPWLVSRSVATRPSPGMKAEVAHQLPLEHPPSRWENGGDLPLPLSLPLEASEDGEDSPDEKDPAVDSIEDFPRFHHVASRIRRLTVPADPSLNSRSRTISLRC